MIRKVTSTVRPLQSPPTAPAVSMQPKSQITMVTFAFRLNVIVVPNKFIDINLISSQMSPHPGAGGGGGGRGLRGAGRWADAAAHRRRARPRRERPAARRGGRQPACQGPPWAHRHGPRGEERAQGIHGGASKLLRAIHAISLALVRIWLNPLPKTTDNM